MQSPSSARLITWHPKFSKASNTTSQSTIGLSGVCSSKLSQATHPSPAPQWTKHGRTSAIGTKSSRNPSSKTRTTSSQLVRGI